MTERDLPGVNTDDASPHESAHGVRRDLPPDRGFLLNMLSQTAVILNSITLFCFAFPLLFLALPLGLMVYRAARRDLAMIRAGRLDPRGYQETWKAFALARFALWFSFTILILWGLVVAAIRLA
jgi:hypothetical protein